MFFLNATLLISTWSLPLAIDVESRATVSSRDGLNLIQYFHCLGLGLGLEGYCFGFDFSLEYTVLVSCLVETFINTVGHNANCTCAIFTKVVLLSWNFC